MSITSSRAPDSNGVVVFYGRCGEVSRTNSTFQSTLRKLVQIHESIVVISNNNGQEIWKNFEKDVSSLTNYMLNPDQRVLQYQMELIQEGLLPYLGSLKGRMHVDNQRFKQISTIIRIILNNQNDHPALVLQRVDDIVLDIKNNAKFHLWKSELLTTLETATEKQWEPIVADNRRVLIDYGSKLLLLGLIGAIGWPVAFLYPMYKLALTLMAILQEWEKKKRLSTQSIFQLAKTIVILIASGQILAILSVYASLGYTCLLAGGIAITVSSNNALIKKTAPVLAPHMAQLDQLMNTLSQTDFSMIISKFKTSLNQQHSSSGCSMASERVNMDTTYVSERVEELPSTSTSSSSASKRDEIHTTARAQETSGLSVPLSRQQTSNSAPKPHYQQQGESTVESEERDWEDTWETVGSADEASDGNHNSSSTSQVFPVGVRKRST